MVSIESNLIQHVKDFKLPNGSTMEEWLTKHPALTKVEWKIDPTGDLKVVHFIGVVNLGKIYKVLHPWTFDKQVSEDEAAYNARKDLASCGIKTLMVMVQFKRRYPDNPNSEFAQHFSFVAVGVNERVVVKEDAMVQGLLSKFLNRDLTSFCRFDLLDFGPFRGYASEAAYQQAMAPFEEEDKRREAAKRANWSTLDDFIRASDIPTLAKFLRQAANAADRPFKKESIFNLNLLCDPVKIRISNKEVDDLRKVARPLGALDDIQLSQFATRLKNQVVQEKSQPVPGIPQ